MFVVYWTCISVICEIVDSHGVLFGLQEEDNFKKTILGSYFNIENKLCEALGRYWTVEISDVSDQGDRIRYWRVLSQSVPGRTRWEIWLDLRYWEIGGRTTGDICNSEN